MKYIILIPFLFALAHAQPSDTATGQSIQGPETLGQPTYPNSGLSRGSNDQPGEELPTSSEMSSEVPATAAQQRQEEAKKFKTGPYDKDGNYTIDLKEKSSDLPE